MELLIGIVMSILSAVTAYRVGYFRRGREEQHERERLARLRDDPVRPVPRDDRPSHLNRIRWTR